MTTACDHTLDHRRGSWHIVTSDDRRKVVCGECGRFFGYVNTPEPDNAPLSPRVMAILAKSQQMLAAKQEASR